MIYLPKLHQVSSVLIFVGACLNKIQFLPIPVLQLPSIVLSISIYLMGYACWFIAASNDAHTPPLKNTWYGFSEFKNQIKLASSLGIIAVLFCAVSLVFPPAIIVGMWFFVASNVVWFIAEFHKYNNPPVELNYSSTRQKTYLQYVSLISLLSVVTALSTTIAIVFPITAPLTFILMVMISVVISLTALIYLFDYQLGEHTPDLAFKNSYQQMNELGYNKTLKPVRHLSLDKPEHFKPLFTRSLSCPTLISNSAEIEENLLGISPIIS